MTLLIICAVGMASGYFSIWTAVVFNESVEERVKSLLIGIIIDVIMLIIFKMYGFYGYENIFSWFLIYKYIFLSIVNFDETLRQ